MHKISCRYCIGSEALDSLGRCYAGSEVNDDKWPCRHLMPVKRFLCDNKGVEVDYERCEGCFKALEKLDNDCTQHRLVIRKIIDYLNPPEPKVELVSVVRFRRVK